MSQIVQLSLKDLETLFKKWSGQSKPPRPVPLKRAMKETGMSAWEIRNAVKDNPAIKPERNKYNVELLRSA